MARVRAKRSLVFSIPLVALIALGATAAGVWDCPDCEAVGPDHDTVLVDYRKVHEEAGGGADSGVSPDGTWLTFSHSKTGNREVYAVHTETGEIKNLTNSPDDEWEARWHPDGTHIVFTANRNGQNGVFIRNLETGEEITVMSTKEGYEDYPSFSKDGRSVSFTAGPMGYREVYRWDWDTGEVTPITRGHNYVGSTNFSADGTKIVYHAYYGGSYSSEKADIFVVDANGGRGVNITHNDDVWVYKAQWSPDGNWIAFSARYDSPKFNLWVMRTDGSERTKITDVAGEDFRWADWTADGRLAWHGITPQQGRLVAVDVSTGERHELMVRDDYVRSLSASPDGSTLVFESGGDVFVADAEAGAAPRRLADGTQPRFSSDGRTVAYVRNRRSRVGMVSVEGGEPTVVEQRVADWPATASSGWSPDGMTMAVVTGEGAALDITLVSRDGTKRALTEDGTRKSTPVWSSDGRFVFFAENEPNRVGYYITNESVTARMNQVTADAGSR